MFNVFCIVLEFKVHFTLRVQNFLVVNDSTYHIYIRLLFYIYIRISIIPIQFVFQKHVVFYNKKGFLLKVDNFLVVMSLRYRLYHHNFDNLLILRLQLSSTFLWR